MWLLLVAAFGFVVPNGFFVYWLVNEFHGFGPVLQDNLALGFILVLALIFAVVLGVALFAIAAHNGSAPTPSPLPTG